MDSSFLIPTFLTALMVTACVAKDPDSLGELESGNDDGMTTSNGSSEGASEGGSATSASAGSETGETESGETGPLELCPDPAFPYFEPAACPTNDATPLLPGAGCYEPCEGPDSRCTVGVCSEVQTNPCVCAEGDDGGGDCCAACGSLDWLCVDGLPDLVCAEVVGTTFSSVEELECGLGPKGVELCRWTVEFDESGGYLWMHSDLGEGGPYTCEGGAITVGNNPGLEASYDPRTGILTWDGVDYVADAG